MDIASSAQDSLHVKFLGTASFLISYKGDAVLTDPFISNPPGGQLFFGKIKSNPEIVDKYLPQEDIDKIDMVTIGHSHYDHLLDLPYIYPKLHPKAKLLGSQTAAYLMAPFAPGERMIILNELKGDHLNLTDWIYNEERTIRIMPFACAHPYHIGKIIFFNGSLKKEMKKIPKNPGKWKVGETYSYIIDFLDPGKDRIQYRVFFKGSEVAPPMCIYPEEINTEKNPDITIIPAATVGFGENLTRYAIDHSNPSIVFLDHWENFLIKKEKPVRTVPRGDPEKYYKELAGQFKDSIQIIMPMPGAEFEIK